MTIHLLAEEVESELIPRIVGDLRGKGFELTGSEEGRFAVVPEQAHGRLIWFTQHDVPGYPRLGSKLTQPAEFAA